MVLRRRLKAAGLRSPAFAFSCAAQGDVDVFEGADGVAGRDVVLMVWGIGDIARCPYRCVRGALRARVRLDLIDRSHVERLAYPFGIRQKPYLDENTRDRECGFCSRL